MHNPDLGPTPAASHAAGVASAVSGKAIADTPAEAQGRRTLSTSFVRIGPDGHLTVELRDGQQLVLRDVIMRPRDYCGVRVSGGKVGSRYCGGYADVVGARPGGGPLPGEPDPMTSPSATLGKAAEPR